MEAILIICLSIFAIIGIVNLISGIVNTLNSPLICNICTITVDIKENDSVDSILYALNLVLEDKHLGQMKVIVRCAASGETYRICKKYCDIHKIKMIVE